MHCILHITATNFFGGPEKQICQHCASMDPQRWRMVVCSFLEGKRENGLLRRAAAMNLPTAAIKTANPYNPWVLVELISIIRQKNPGIIVAHGYRSLIICLLTRPFHRKRVIAYSRGYTGENRKVRFFETIHRFLLGFSDLILAVSEGHRRALLKAKVPGDKLKVVYNAVSYSDTANKVGADWTERFLDELDGSPAKFVVTAGRLSPEKGHRFLIEAVKILGEKTQDTYFLFCGDGPLANELKRQSHRLGVDSKCIFLGFRRDLPAIFAKMDFLVLPSLSEGLPNVILEAFAQAKPVVATAVGGVPEVVDQGINGLLVPPGHPEKLAAAIEKLIQSVDLRKRMGKAAYNKVKRNFSLEKQKEAMTKIYRTVQQSDNGSRPVDAE